MNEIRIGVALGGGGVAALSYVGVLQELAAAGIRFHCVAGTSAGAVVGAALAAGQLDEFRQVMTSLTRGRVLTLFDPSWGRGGFIDGRRAMEMLTPVIGHSIEALPIRFAAVATDLETGGEAVLDRGSVIEAVRASIAIPGVFRPRVVDGRVLVDGGLVNPIPVSVARGMDADFVIAVSVLRIAGLIDEMAESTPDTDDPASGNGSEHADQAAAPPGDCRLGVFDVISKGSAVVQSHIAAARLRDDPPDAFLVPRSEHIGTFEMLRCAEAVEIGREVARRALPSLLESIERARHHRSSSRLRRLFSSPLARHRAI